MNLIPDTGDAEPLTRPCRDLITRSVALADRFAGLASATDRDGAFPAVEFAELFQAGLLTAPLPSELGGRSLGRTADGSPGSGSTAALLRVLEELGRGNLSVGRLYEGHVNALLLIRQFGTPDQQAAWAHAAHAGQIFGVWNTQAADGIRFGTEAPDGGIDLTGAKTFASGAGHVARPLITGACPDGGWQMAVVPCDEVDARVDTSWWRPLGMKASASHRVDFTGVRISARACLLGSPGDYYREPAFSGGAIRFAAVQLGGVRALLDATVAALREFGRTDDPYQRARVGTMAIAVESGRQWLQEAARVADQNAGLSDHDAVARVITHAQMTRIAIEAIGQDVLRLAEQAVGARGLLRPHPIERIGRDLTLYLRQPGPDAALAQVGEAWLDASSPTPNFHLSV